MHQFFFPAAAAIVWSELLCSAEVDHILCRLQLVATVGAAAAAAAEKAKRDNCLTWKKKWREFIKVVFLANFYLEVHICLTKKKVLSISIGESNSNLGSIFYSKGTSNTAHHERCSKKTSYYTIFWFLMYHFMPCFYFIHSLILLTYVTFVKTSKWMVTSHCKLALTIWRQNNCERETTILLMHLQFRKASIRPLWANGCHEGCLWGTIKPLVTCGSNQRATFTTKQDPLSDIWG